MHACGPHSFSLSRVRPLRLAIGTAVLILLGNVAVATPGGLNAQGCHNDRKGGAGYHCHGGMTRAADRPQPLRLQGSSAVFPNCSAARAAGAAPVRRGDPGYGLHLDRDNDGVGCER
ncbi:excalibur calcium-binding domain-containing protein [Sphingomonas sp.]|uniref:excalibur calcium-binding domain-containing protein n=1 Tax=Sphingomonas sp. TaxID=28214 RepID=UPI002601A047|nr:excalibur calcium-binding domain-containing protein [Sphingomonas sp.]